MAQNFFGDQGTGFAWWAALLLEILMTAVFLWVILAVTDERNEINAAMGPLAIGLALAMIHFASMSATGTSVNPARSIGVGVFAGTDAIVQLWLFVVAPLVGAAIAGLTYPVLFGHGAEPVAGSGLNFGGGRKDQFVPGSYEAQWNQGQQGGWGQPGAAWGGTPPQQQPQPQWGQPAAAARPVLHAAGAARARPVGPARHDPAGAAAAAEPARPVGRSPAAAARPARSARARGSRSLGQPGRRRRRPHPGAPPRPALAGRVAHQHGGPAVVQVLEPTRGRHPSRTRCGSRCRPRRASAPACSTGPRPAGSPRAATARRR